MSKDGDSNAVSPVPANAPPQPRISISKRSSETGTLRDDPIVTSAEHISPTVEKSPRYPETTDNDTFIVDWEGPEDPENPKKCVMIPPTLCFTLDIDEKWEKLAYSSEVGSDCHRVIVHLHFASLFIDDCACK